MDRLKEIKHKRYELILQLKEIKKELIKLRQEEDMINGYKRLEKTRKDK